MNYVKDTITQLIGTEELLKNIIDCIQEKKGQDLVQLDLTKLDEAPTNTFIICHGDSTIQVKAIADNVLREVKKRIGTLPSHVEGQQNATWILIDYFDIVIHIFSAEAREFYQLEALWSDAEVSKHEEIQNVK